MSLHLQLFRELYAVLSLRKEITPGEYNRLLLLLVEKVVVWEDKLELILKTSGIKSLMEELKNE